MTLDPAAKRLAVRNGQPEPQARITRTQQLTGMKHHRGVRVVSVARRSAVLREGPLASDSLLSFISAPEKKQQKHTDGERRGGGLDMCPSASGLECRRSASPRLNTLAQLVLLLRLDWPRHRTRSLSRKKTRPAMVGAQHASSFFMSIDHRVDRFGACTSLAKTSFSRFEWGGPASRVAERRHALDSDRTQETH